MNGEYIFTSTEFVEKCVELAKSYKTVYALGMWGWQLTREAINTKARQLPDFYTEEEKKKLYALADEGGNWGVDCVCMIKALLWGWDGSNLPRGGARYASNGVPDFGADGILKYCPGYTTDFDKIEPGWVLHMKGHVGVYIGDGLAVECTRAWEAKVMITAVGNLGKKAGYHTRTWTHCGRLVWINYNEEDQPLTPAERKELDNVEAAVNVIVGKINTIAENINKIDESITTIVKYIKKINEELKQISPDVERHDAQLKIYETWDDIKREIPWAYKPLWAMHKAGFFAGESKDRPMVNRIKAECLVADAAELKNLGIISY